MITLIFAEVDLVDAILEGLTVVAYLFVFFMIIKAKRNNKIFASKSFPLLILAIGLGTIAGGMDLFSEFFWIENNYNIFKFFMEFTKIAGLLLFAISLLLVFRFTKFLMGDE